MEAIKRKCLYQIDPAHDSKVKLIHVINLLIPEGKLNPFFLFLFYSNISEDNVIKIIVNVAFLVS